MGWWWRNLSVVGTVLCLSACSADTIDRNRQGLEQASGPAFGPPAMPNPVSAEPQPAQAPPAGPVPESTMPVAGGAAPETTMTPEMPAPMMSEPEPETMMMPEMPTPTDTGDDMGTTTPPGEDVPMSAHCEPAADWDPTWAEFEQEVLRLTNEARAVGHNCDTKGEFGPAGPLTMNAMLRCSARLHSMDMGEQGYFAHEGLNGSSPGDRMGAAGYTGVTWGENIAKGQQTPQEVVNGWLDSDGHCANMMNPGFAEIGVGYWEGEATNQFFNGNKLWTQNFGAQGGGGTCWWCGG